ncbi:hypothetical protein ACW69C_30365 [Streptomyces sp. MN3]
MTLPRTSRDIMTWQPPPGWGERSRQERAAYLREHGIEIPVRPADWSAMEHEQRMAYLEWIERHLYDTPEARAARRREYRRERFAWRVLMGWWIACLAAALLMVWWPAGPLDGAAVALRVLFTAFVLGGYAAAILLPMWLVRPSAPQR